MWSGGTPPDDDLALAEKAESSSDSHESSSSDEDEDDGGDAHMHAPTMSSPMASSPSVPSVVPPPQPRGKPEAMAAKLASAARLQEKMDELEMEDDVVAEPLDDSLDMTMGTVDTVATVETQKETQKKKIKRKTPPKKSSPKADLLYPTMDDPTPDHVTAAQYENLESMMSQFCRVPLLAEFSRPVALLHPEVCLMLCILELSNRALEIFC